MTVTGAQYDHAESHLPPTQRQTVDLPPLPATLEHAWEQVRQGVSAGNWGGPGPMPPAPTGTSAAASGTIRPSPASSAYQHPDLPHVSFRTVDVLLQPYLTAAEYRAWHEMSGKEGGGSSPAPARAGASTGASLVAPGESPGLSGSEGLRVSDSGVGNAKGGGAPPAASEDTPQRQTILQKAPATYAPDMVGETQRYADLACAIGREQEFDVIHAHDWMTFPAGLAVAARSGKPLIVHVHSTEYDRNGNNANPQVVAIEQAGLAGAARIIAVSHLTKRLLVGRYGVSADKIEVIHNAIDLPAKGEGTATKGKGGGSGGGIESIRKDEKIVLFLGRITAQKGPEYFLAAAQKVLAVYPKVKFIMAGTGDLLESTVERAAEMGIGHKVLFTGFLNSRDVLRAYRMAHLFVMSSVSEPFGIAPLEALANNVPVIISKQSGVSEVLEHALKVDFWDTDELANKILAVLRHPALARTLKKNAKIEIKKRSWLDAADEVLGVYESLASLEHGENSGPRVPCLMG